MGCTLKKESVKQLLYDGNYRFSIPAYQRGYRWQTSEINKLINDIKGNKAEEYFLQVLVLKKNNDVYDIVDGQQRLTTLSILLSEIDKKLVNKELLNDGRDSIDMKFMENVKEIFNHQLSLEKIYNCYFLVYELDAADDAEKVFERLNVGKIPLSSAELLKAHLISQELNIEDKKTIAKRWQDIEKLLQRDDFFYFICPDYKDKRYQNTRMDFLLELAYFEENEDSNLNSKYEKNPLFIYEALENSINIEKIEKLANKLFVQWYLPLDKFNMFGFYIYKTTSPNPFYAIKMMNENTDLRDYAKDYKKFREYRKGYNDASIREILLLYSVKKYMEKGIRFDFVRFYDSKCDIEHIHALNQEEYDENSIVEMIINLYESGFYKREIESFIGQSELNNESVKKKLNEIIGNKTDHGEPEPYKTLIAEINKKITGKEFEENDLDIGDRINELGNLVLLPAHINRSISNYIYPIKCAIVSKYAREGTIYIPFCVADKYDRKRIEWNGEAFDKYIEDLELTILGDGHV